MVGLRRLLCASSSSSSSAPPPISSSVPFLPQLRLLLSAFSPVFPSSIFSSGVCCDFSSFLFGCVLCSSPSGCSSCCGGSFFLVPSSSLPLVAGRSPCFGGLSAVSSFVSSGCGFFSDPPASRGRLEGLLSASSYSASPSSSSSCVFLSLFAMVRSVLSLFHGRLFGLLSGCWSVRFVFFLLVLLPVVSVFLSSPARLSRRYLFFSSWLSAVWCFVVAS